MFFWKKSRIPISLSHPLPPPLEACLLNECYNFCINHQGRRRQCGSKKGARSVAPPRVGILYLDIITTSDDDHLLWLKSCGSCQAPPSNYYPSWLWLHSGVSSGRLQSHISCIAALRQSNPWHDDNNNNRNNSEKSIQLILCFFQGTPSITGFEQSNFTALPTMIESCHLHLIAGN